MAKYLNKYRIPTSRLKGWDYRRDSAYFTTICTKNRRYPFGEVINKEIRLNEIGKLAHQFWNEIPKHFPQVVLVNF